MKVSLRRAKKKDALGNVSYNTLSRKSLARSVFGYTTLLQPKKPVTRAEAASAIWFFGNGGEGMTAQEALKAQQQPQNTQQPQNQQPPNQPQPQPTSP